MENQTELYRDPDTRQGIPEEITRRGRFCLWRYEERGGRRTKVPVNPRTGGRARSNSPEDFCSAEELRTLKRQHPSDGCGLGIFDGVCAIDLDDCFLDGGELTPEAKDIVNTMHTYTEYSPSGRGLHLLFLAEGFAYDQQRYYIMNHPVGVEIYVAGATSKYVTVTGRTYPGMDSFGDRTEELKTVLERYMRRKNGNTGAVYDGSVSGGTPTDDALIALACGRETFRRLWEGDTAGYTSHSEADMALCASLAFWTGKDRGRMDRLFRRSGLMREKWDRPQSGTTYGAVTVARAAENCHEVYTPRREPPKPLSFRPIVPLMPENEPLPAFPTDSLPAAVAAYARDVSAATQTAVDMAGVIALGVLAIALQGKLEVCINNSWHEQLSLLTTIVAEPGERKSPVMKLMAGVIDDYERVYNREREPMLLEARLNREVAERNITRLKRELEKASDPAREEELRKAEAELAGMEEERPVRFTADDCTSEALTALMARNGGRIGVISAEGGIFDILAGRYNNRVNLDVWLKGWCGDTIRVDRQQREPQYISHPCLSACFAIQPSILGELMENPVMNGRGLVARFLFAVPPSRVGSRSFRAPGIPREDADAYRALIFRLMALPVTADPAPLFLSEEAEGLIGEHFAENERFLTGKGQIVAGWGNKYIGTVLRIAGLISAAEGEMSCISGGVMRRAIGLGQYFRAHTLQACSLSGVVDFTRQQAAFALSRMKEKQVTAIRDWELFKLCRGRFFHKKEDIFPVLELLEEHGYIAVQDTVNCNHRQSKTITLNPDALSA